MRLIFFLITSTLTSAKFLNHGLKTCHLGEIMSFIERSSYEEVGIYTWSIVRAANVSCETENSNIPGINIKCSDPSSCKELAAITPWISLEPFPLFVIIGKSYHQVTSIIQYGYTIGAVRPNHHLVAVVEDPMGGVDPVPAFRYLPNIILIHQEEKVIQTSTVNQQKMTVQKQTRIPYSRLDSTNFRLFPEKLILYGDSRLKVCYGLWEPYVFKLGDTLHGVDVTIMTTLAKYLKFKMELIPSFDGYWGSLVNGSWNGMVRMVMDGRADIGMSPFTMTSLRETVIDFTSSYKNDYLTFVSPLSELLSKWKALLMPFTIAVWVALLIAILLGIVTYVLLSLADYSESKKNPWNAHSFFFIYNCLTKQSVKYPSTNSQRVFALVWLLFCIIITSAYAGILTSFLTKQLRSTPIQTTPQLLNTNLPINKFDFGGPSMSFFKAVYPKIYEKIKFVSSFSFGFSNVRKGKSILIDMMTGLKFFEHNITKGKGPNLVTFSKEQWYPQSYAYIVETDSPYKEGLNRGIHRLQTFGLIQKWFDDFLGSTLFQTQNDQKVVLSFENLKWCFLLLIFGLNLSFITFTYESLRFRYS